MYIDKTWLQRLVYLIAALYIVTFGVVIAHECGNAELPVEETIVEEAEQQPVVYIVYVYVDSKPETEEKEEAKYYDVPLSAELQEHIINLCEERDVDPALILAMIKAESSFNADAVGDSGSALGLMQIWPKWHQSRMEQYGCDDLMDPFQNVTVGIDIVADWLDAGKGVEYALMGYNGGAAYAKSMIADGEVSAYAQKVLGYYEEIREAA